MGVYQLRISVRIFLLCISVGIIHCQRELFASQDGDHDCWRPLQTTSETAPSNQVYYVFVSENEKTCYYLSTQMDTHPQAQQTCTALAPGAQLFSDASWEENQFFIRTVTPSCDFLRLGSSECSAWLGIRWNGTCRWDDGTTFRWSNWPREAFDQCLQPYSNRYCAYVDRSGSWDVRFCQKRQLVLCEWFITLPPGSAALTRAASARIAWIVFLVLILIILVLLLVFILLGRFYFCPRVRDAVVSGYRTNAPDVEQVDQDSPDVSDAEVEVSVEEEPEEGEVNTDADYQTIPLKEKPHEGSVDEEKDDSDEKKPFLDEKEPLDDPVMTPEVQNSPYATPQKNKRPKPKPVHDWDEITVIENDVRA